MLNNDFMKKDYLRCKGNGQMVAGECRGLIYLDL